MSVTIACGPLGLAASPSRNREKQWGQAMGTHGNVLQAGERSSQQRQGRQEVE